MLRSRFGRAWRRVRAGRGNVMPAAPLSSAARDAPPTYGKPENAAHRPRAGDPDDPFAALAPPSKAPTPEEEAAAAAAAERALKRQAAYDARIKALAERGAHWDAVARDVAAKQLARARDEATAIEEATPEVFAAKRAEFLKPDPKLGHWWEHEGLEFDPRYDPDAMLEAARAVAAEEARCKNRSFRRNT